MGVMAAPWAPCHQLRPLPTTVNMITETWTMMTETGDTEGGIGVEAGAGAETDTGAGDTGPDHGAGVGDFAVAVATVDRGGTGVLTSGSMTSTGQMTVTLSRSG